MNQQKDGKTNRCEIRNTCFDKCITKKKVHGTFNLDYKNCGHAAYYKGKILQNYIFRKVNIHLSNY